MTSQGLLLILLAAMISASSNLLLRVGVKAGGGFGVSEDGFVADLLRLAVEPAFLAGVMLYAVAALVWFRIMSTEQLSQSYVVLVSLTFVLVLIGSTFFGEPLTTRKILGSAVVLIGIYLTLTA